MTPKDRLGDRRSDLRFEIIGPLFGSLETVDPLPLHNVGRGGALVESRVALETDSVQTVRLGYNGQAAELQAVVRHVTQTLSPIGERYLIGLEFLGLSDEATKHIDTLVDATAWRAPGVSEA